MKNTFSNETLVNYIEKSPPRAGQKTSAGQIELAGRTLPTPALSASLKIGKLISNCCKVLKEYK